MLQVASNRFIHPWMSSGRCMVMWPRPWQAMRAVTAISQSSVGPDDLRFG